MRRSAVSPDRAAVGLHFVTVLSQRRVAPVVIDWVSAKVPFACDGLLSGGMIASFDRHGEVEWQSQKYLPIVGSFSAKIMVKSAGQNMIEISGNPAKFLQGHNLFGSDDLCGLMLETLRRVAASVDYSPSDCELAVWRSGTYELQRVDITYMYQLPSTADVRTWIRAAEFQSKSRHGRPSTKSGTLYWGKNSRRWSMKAYSKEDEIGSTKDHQLPQEIPHREELAKYASGMLRVELVLRSMQLKELGAARYAANWKPHTATELHSQFLETINMSTQVTLSANIRADLPPRLLCVYTLWRDGHDPRAIYPKNTFYRYRRELLPFDVDIAIIQPTLRDNVIPLVRALRPEAVTSVPGWARGTSIYFEPRERLAA